jgi:hypothetical protein
MIVRQGKWVKPCMMGATISRVIKTRNRNQCAGEPPAALPVGEHVGKRDINLFHSICQYVALHRIAARQNTARARAIGQENDRRS